MLVSYSHIRCISQSGNTNKNPGNEIGISIGGIDYDDPNFALLKENLQKNKNVRSIKQSYDQGTATITMSYTGNAQDLWEELPKTTKEFFKLTTP